MPGVKDRVVVVTGAGGGLGREYALLLARAGARVVVNDLGVARNGGPPASESGGPPASKGVAGGGVAGGGGSGAGSAMADQVVAEIEGEGGQAVANYDSVATADGAQAIVGTALDAFGAIHGVVNNAGILRDSAFHKMSDDDWEAVQRVHLFGGYHVTRAAWPHFREQGHGRVVMATSTSGLYGRFGQSNYGAAKAGLVGLVHTLAQEGRKHNILANAVAPIAATRMTNDIAPADLLAKLPADQVAPIVGYLLTDECTDSGTVVVAGGGQVHRAQLFASAGVTFSGTPSIDEVAEAWPRITDMTGAVPGVDPVG